MRYSGRDFTEAELQWLRNQLHTKKAKNRSTLSRLFCEQFGWKKANGTVKDVSCRVAFLRMEKDGLITLPPRQSKPRIPFPPVQRTLFGETRPGISKKARDFTLRLEVVTKHTSKLWNEFIDRYHYLGYVPLPGAQLRYLVFDDDEIIALLGFGAAAWKTAPRDQYIGWSEKQRQANLNLIINNARFLILPWVTSYNLGSRILSLVHKHIAQDWEHVYHYRPTLLETFVDKERFTGTVYKASNWIYVGDTTGRGKKSLSKRQVIPIKSVWLFPLLRNFRPVLCGNQSHEK